MATSQERSITGPSTPDPLAFDNPHSAIDSTGRAEANNSAREHNISTNVPTEKETRFRGQGTPESPYIVDWEEGDPENPYNWSKARKWFFTLQASSVNR
jgi:hypothetical protein